MIRLEAIDETNWRYPLRVSEAQKAYVAGTAALLEIGRASCRERV